MDFIAQITAVARLPKKLEKFNELTKNLWWTWNPEAQDLFRVIDPDLWYSVNRSPVRLLRNVSQKRLEELCEDKDFLEEFDAVYKKFKEYMTRKNTWITKNYPDRKEECIAYFCAEYGFHESFPIYSGGLGILAGDHLKTASDIGLNLVGVGLLYKQGYFTQLIDGSGWQQAEYPSYDFEDFPVLPALDKNGEEIFVNVDFSGKKVWAKVWKLMVGKTPLILLDTDITRNSQEDRRITNQLYGGDREMRIRQELLLGIGGVRALRILGYNPKVWHMNEGHAAFLSLERIREYVQGKGFEFKKAVQTVKASNVFTTHTPVPAGNDVFDMVLIDKYFGEFWPGLNVTRKEFIELGFEKNIYGFEQYSMTVLALNMSVLANGVSELHGKVSRKMWQHIYPELPDVEVPISHITNGVHIWTWLNKDLKSLLNKYLPEGWEDKIESPEIWGNVDRIPDEEIWETHMKLKRRMQKFLQGRLKKQRMRLGETVEDLLEVDEILPEDTLTIGFARRFATYKRATLILKDIERFKKILNNSEKPIQLVFAGKAHPADNPGKELIKKVYELSRLPEFKNRVVFIENYDMNVAKHMVSGVDIWLNSPRRPHEASGTSGQKAGMNGVLNFSAMDGWWVEGYNETNGWAIGDNRDYDDAVLQDKIDSVSIYSTLEKEIVPLYYHRDKNNIPREWVARLKNSIKTIGCEFNTQRMLIDYVNKMYMRAAAIYDEIAENDYKRAREIADWKQHLIENWKYVKVIPGASVDVYNQTLNVGDKMTLSANVYLGELEPEEIQVEIFIAKINEKGDIEEYKIFPMSLQKEDVHGEYIYSGDFILPNEGKLAYTIRVVPKSDKLPERNILPIAKWVGDK